MTLETKRCTRCGEEKPLNRFGTIIDHRLSQPRRKNSWCFDCTNARRKERKREQEEIERLEKLDIEHGRVKQCGECNEVKAYSRFVYENGRPTDICSSCQKLKNRKSSVPNVLSSQEVEKLRRLVGINVLRQSGEAS